MSNQTINLDRRLYDYLVSHSVREADVLRRLRIETAQLDMAIMQVSPEQGQFMALLLKILAAKRVIEVGVFTGYSSLCMALAMPPQSEIIACDINQEWTEIARRYWKEAGVSERIRLTLAPAIETLDGLIDDGEAASFDFAFIDADKSNYVAYYEKCLTLLRPGGVIAVDNVLWGGAVADDKRTDEDTLAIRRLNELMYRDERVDISLVPIGDGLTLARRKQAA